MKKGRRRERRAVSRERYLDGSRCCDCGQQWAGWSGDFCCRDCGGKIDAFATVRQVWVPYRVRWWLPCSWAGGEWCIARSDAPRRTLM